MFLPKKVKIVEVGPRDGLQNEKKIVSVADKIHFIKLLTEAGFEEIEAGAFVSPKWVPQMAGSQRLFLNLQTEKGGATYSALVPNEKGMEAALKCQVKKVAVFTAASETFNQKNINCSIDESIKRFEPVVKMARAHRVAVRGYVSTAFVCPYEGEISVQVVMDVVQKLLDLGIEDISIGDTIGKATREQVQALLSLLIHKHPSGVAMHFHDTYGLALQNVEESLKFGITCFDASAGGLGGCPYAPGAKGNVSTNALVKFFDQKKIVHGIDLRKLEMACEFIGNIFGINRA